MTRILLKETDVIEDADCLPSLQGKKRKDVLATYENTTSFSIQRFSTTSQRFYATITM